MICSNVTTKGFLVLALTVGATAPSIADDRQSAGAGSQLDERSGSFMYQGSKSRSSTQSQSGNAASFSAGSSSAKPASEWDLKSAGDSMGLYERHQPTERDVRGGGGFAGLFETKQSGGSGSLPFLAPPIRAGQWRETTPATAPNGNTATMQNGSSGCGAQVIAAVERVADTARTAARKLAMVAAEKAAVARAAAAQAGVNYDTIVAKAVAGDAGPVGFAPVIGQAAGAVGQAAGVAAGLIVKQLAGNSSPAAQAAIAAAQDAAAAAQAEVGGLQVADFASQAANGIVVKVNAAEAAAQDAASRERAGGGMPVRVNSGGSNGGFFGPSQGVGQERRP